MKNYVQEGNIIEVVAGAEGIVSGDAVVILGTVGIAIIDAKEGETATVSLKGVYELPKANVGLGQGEKAFWKKDDGNVAKAGVKFGIVWEDALKTDTTVKVKLTQ